MLPQSSSKGVVGGGGGCYNHMMPDLGSQLHCTLYTFIVLVKIMYSNIFYGIVFYCIVVLLCSNILLL